MKRRQLVALSSVCALVLMACVSVGSDGSVQGLSSPTVDVTRFEIQAISLRDVTFLFELTVQNPYPVSLSFNGMDLDFSVQGTKVASVNDRGGFSVAANGKKANSFTVTLTYASIIALVKDYTAKDWLDTVVDGKVSLPLPSIPGVPPEMSFSYQLKKQIPAIKPSVGITGFSVTPPTAAEVAQAVKQAGMSVDAGSALSVFLDLLAGKKPSTPVIDPAKLDLPLRLRFNLEIRNDAKGPLDVSALGYALFINGEPLVQGQAESIKRDGQKLIITVVSTFSSRQLTSGILAIFRDKAGSFRVSGSASLKLPDAIRAGAIPLAFDESGRFSFM